MKLHDSIMRSQWDELRGRKRRDLHHDMMEEPPKIVADDEHLDRERSWMNECMVVTCYHVFRTCGSFHENGNVCVSLMKLEIVAHDAGPCIFRLISMIMRWGCVFAEFRYFVVVEKRWERRSARR